MLVEVGRSLLREENDGEAKLSGKSLLREENDVEATDCQGKSLSREESGRSEIVRVALARGRRW